MIDEPLAENPFWDFSVALYSDESVATQCLSMQDDWDADVNLLLYGIWLAHHGIAWTIDEITTLQKEFEPWRKTTIMPLRTVRRRLRFQTKRRYYNFLKALELRAERHQQDRLWLHWQTSHPSLSTTPASDALFAKQVTENLRLYLQRLEMRPRSQSMFPKAEDQLLALTATILQRRTG